MKVINVTYRGDKPVGYVIIAGRSNGKAHNLQIQVQHLGQEHQKRGQQRHP